MRIRNFAVARNILTISLVISVIFFPATVLAAGSAIAVTQSDQNLSIANGQLRIEIVRADKGFYLSGVDDLATGEKLISVKAPAILWELTFRKDKGRDLTDFVVTSLDGGKLSSSIDRKDSQVTVRLLWKGLAVAGEADAVDVEVTATVKQGDPLSRWRINVTNRSKVYGLWEVLFPVVQLGPIGAGAKTNHLTIPKSRGIVVDDPFNAPKGFGAGMGRGQIYPGSHVMQFHTLYDDAGVGIYMAIYDGQGYRKSFYVDQVRDKQMLVYKVGHYPANMGYPAEDYSMTYDACIGPFSGNWYDACQIYRQWGLQQKWCRFGPMRTRENMPKWFKESPLVLKTETAFRERSVIDMRDEMLEVVNFIGMKMPIDWYTWQVFFPEKTSGQRPDSQDHVFYVRAYHGTNVHDGIYPALPALDNFAQACEMLYKAGGYVKAFVPARIYDPGLNDNVPFIEQARPARVLEAGHVYNWAHHNAYWFICKHSPWWQNRLKDEIVALIKNENCHGTYFDTFYGGTQQCFDTRHGHSHGGGNDPYLGAYKQSEVVMAGMKQADPESVATGEKPSETAIDLLDGFLLHWPIWPDMAPMLATVYGDYIVRHGNFLAPDSDGFYVQAAAMFTEGGTMGRLRFQMNYDYWMKDIETGGKYSHKMKFMKKLCHYWKPNVALQFLAYGQLLRPIEFSKPVPMPMFSYNETSRYVRAYKDGLITAPALMNGVFKTDNGDLGVIIVNVTDKPVDFSFELAADRYPISESASYAVTAIDNTGKRGKTASSKGKITHSGKIAGYDALFLEITEN